LPPVDELLERVRQGAPAAVDDLFAEHRGRLKKMVSLRIDPRVSARIDPSDVVQESMAEAASRLDQYLIDEPIPFYPWLRQIAWEKLIQLHRRHLGSQKRSTAREVTLPVRLTDESVASLSRIAVVEQDSPSEQVVREELCRRTTEALERLQPSWKELLVMRYLE
jgi:RNA polymerase sigma-70 factor, ECF subfamily